MDQPLLACPPWPAVVDVASKIIDFEAVRTYIGGARIKAGLSALLLAATHR